MQFYALVSLNKLQQVNLLRVRPKIVNTNPGKAAADTKIIKWCNLPDFKYFFCNTGTHDNNFDFFDTIW